MSISAERTEEFKKDLAHYGVSEDRAGRIEAYLTGNPVAGRPHPDAPGLREWEAGEEVVTFMFVPEIARVYLLRMQPRTEPRGRVLEKLLEMLGILNQIKAFLLRW